MSNLQNLTEERVRSLVTNGPFVYSRDQVWGNGARTYTTGVNLEVLRAILEEDEEALGELLRRMYRGEHLEERMKQFRLEEH